MLPQVCVCVFVFERETHTHTPTQVKSAYMYSGTSLFWTLLGQLKVP